MLSLRAFAAAATLWMVALSCPGQAVAQNVSASQVRLLPALPPFACPAGRVCLVGDASKSPYRAAFVDAAGCKAFYARAEADFRAVLKTQNP